MLNVLRLAWAFVQRDAHTAVSYKSQFVFRISSGFLALCMFYFIAQLIESSGRSDSLGKTFGGYFSFVLIGVVGTAFVNLAISDFSTHIFEGMRQGSIEMMFATPTKSIWIVVLPCCWSFVFEAVRAAIVFFLGVVVFGAVVHCANPLALLAAVGASVLAHCMFGLLSAALVFLTNRSTPLTWVFAQVAGLVSGAYVPIDVLPPWLISVSRSLPTTYSYRAMRTTLLRGGGFADIQSDLIVLGLFTLIGLPVAVLVCDYAIARAKRNGTLGSF